MWICSSGKKIMNFRQRSVIFLTFLISCLAIALLAGKWIRLFNPFKWACKGYELLSKKVFLCEYDVSEGWEWRRKCECDVSNERNIPMMTLPIKKRINAELFIDRKQGSLYTKRYQENFLISLKRVNRNRRKNNSRNENIDGSLFVMAYITQKKVTTSFCSNYILT